MSTTHRLLEVFISHSFLFNALVTALARGGVLPPQSVSVLLSPPSGTFIAKRDAAAALVSACKSGCDLFR